MEEVEEKKAADAERIQMLFEKLQRQSQKNKRKQDEEGEEGEGGVEGGGERRGRRDRKWRKQQAAKTTTAKQAVSAWWDVPYQEQLDRKTKNMRQDCILAALKGIRQAFTDSSESVPKW